MKSYIFEVVIEEDKFKDGRKAYHAHCPALPGCHTSRYPYDEALANIKEAVELYVEDLRESGQPIPVDSAKGTIERPTPSVAVNL